MTGLPAYRLTGLPAYRLDQPAPALSNPDRLTSPSVFPAEAGIHNHTEVAVTRHRRGAPCGCPLSLIPVPTFAGGYKTLPYDNGRESFRRHHVEAGIHNRWNTLQPDNHSPLEGESNPQADLVGGHNRHPVPQSVFPAKAGIHLTRRLRSGLSRFLLCLPLLLGLAAGEAQAQTTLSISAPADANEGDSGTRNLEFTVSQSAGVSLTVNYRVCFTGTATIHTPSSSDFVAPYPDIPAASDYQAVSGIGDSFFGVWDSNCITGTIASHATAPNTTNTIGIRVKGDTDAESDETVIATLSLRGSNPGVTLGTSVATHTILDDDTPAPEISVSLPVSEGESRSDAGEKKVPESEGSVGIGFNLAANQPLPSALTVCVRVTESGTIDRVASADEGIQTANMPSSATNGSGTHTLTWTNTAADDPDSSVTVEVVAPNTVGCSAANDSYTVSSSDGSDKLLIQDDEDTTVSLTSTDRTMTEGDASDPVTLTVSLDRRLYAGEIIGVPIALATTTGARLPGSTDSGTANHDFEVTAAAASMHSGVTLANALTANPRVVFTGHDTNTVQTATVTLTPVANRDDDDTTDETITATLDSLGLLDTTVSGGVTAHASNNAATLTLEDDDSVPSPCPAQNTVFSSRSIYLLENGGIATYCVRLATAPSGGDTTVTITNTGAYQGAINFSPSSLTFTSSNYQTPQQVTVTGVDQPNLHLDRDTRLTHRANGGGYSNQILDGGRGISIVNVYDAPELEVFDLAVWNANDFAAKQRPNTVKATRGFRYFQNDMTPIYPLRYQLRLSNRPATGETVTVTATSSDISKFGLSLTSGGTPQASLTVTFEDRPADRVCFNGGHSSLFDVNTPNPDASWACYRQIWVISTQQYATFEKGCANITHTASGGGLRSTAIGTIRAHAVAGTVFAPSNAPGRDCALITEELRSRSAPATAAPPPTEAVTNVQVTAVDDANARITWDAVEHATSYDVSWSAESSDSLTASSGALPGVTGTTTTIDHGAQQAMTFTVTVTPEYVDKHGDTRPLDSLAGTTSLVVGPGSDALSASAQAEAACVSDALLSDVTDYAGETWRESVDHVERWSRVLSAFGVDNAYSHNPMTVAEAQAQADRGLARWLPIVPALQCLETAQAQPEPQPAQEEQPTPPPVPELSLSSGSAIEEGNPAGFTLTADSAVQSDLTIGYTVSQNGDYLDAPGSGQRTVTLAAGTTTASLLIDTVDDALDEADGAVTVTVDSRTGYTIATNQDTASVPVHDNDEPVVRITAGSGVTEGTQAAFTLSANPLPAAPLDVTVTVAQSGDFAASGETGARTLTLPTSGSIDITVSTIDDSLDEPDGSVTATIDTGAGYTVADSPDDSATVPITDNDVTVPSAPTLSVLDESVKEDAGLMYFTIRLDQPAQHRIKVNFTTRESDPVSARAGQDYYWWWPDGIPITFYPGQTEKKMWVYIYNDNHDEDPETFEVALSSPTGGALIGDGVATGTIINNDPMPAAWLTRFGRTVAQQALDGISDRIAAQRVAGIEGTLAGQALRFGAQTDTEGAVDEKAATDVIQAFHLTEGDDTPHDVFASGYSYSMSTRQALLNSHFTATREKDATGGSLAFWGRAAQGNFDGREGTFSLDGEATTAMLGADYAKDHWLAGLALIQSSGEGNYHDTDTDTTPSPICTENLDTQTRQALCNGAVREGDGQVEASLTAITPYASLQASDSIRLWGTLGQGSGEVTLKPELGDSLTADISWNMAAMGLRGDLVESQAGLSLALTSDALWSRTESDKTHELAASDATVTRLRVGLEGSWRIRLDQGHLTPRLEMGIRQDGGDAETGRGVEIGGGIAWNDPTLGLSLDLSGRTLLSHDSDDLKDQGFAASFVFDPEPQSERGLSMTIGQDWGGAATGGLDALFAEPSISERTGSASESRLRLDIEYGLPAFAGRFTHGPQFSAARSASGREVSVGWRIASIRSADKPDLSFDVKTRWRETNTEATPPVIGIEAGIRW